MEHIALDTELSDQEMEEMLSRVKTADAFDAPVNADSENPESEQALCDEYGFPFEPEGTYNNAPLEFEEVAKALWIALINLNYTATRYHRQSPYYPLLMARLEKNIKQMGSYCITKTVLEQSGEQFPDLEEVTLKELYQMVSLHFRKCCRAYNDMQESGHAQDLSMIGWMFRWAALSDRLKATQERVNKIESGEIKVETILKREAVYKNGPKRQRDRSHHRVAPAVRASSLPVLKSYAREVKAQKRAAEKQERAVQREKERAKKRYDKESEKLLTELGFPAYKPMPLPKIPGLGINEIELKTLLMDEAKGRGDFTEAGIIARENFDQLMERFHKLQDAGPEVPTRQPGKAGPSDETRKKLREKRKKNKK